jgi:hypothetical protein
VSLEFEREQAVQTLCAHYAQEHLSTGELEARFDRVNRSQSRAELITVLSGLPALRDVTTPSMPLYHTAPSALPPGEKRYLALFSEVKKEGAWTPSRTILARVILGSMVLDLRDAELPLEGIDIDLDVILGDCKIILPPGVGATMDVTAVLGSAIDKTQRALPGGPTVRIRGGAVFGEVSVRTALPKPAQLERWRDRLQSFLGGGA